MEKTNKPFYKKWWVWVLGLIVLFIIIGSSGDTAPASDTSANIPSGESESAEVAPQKQYREVFTFSGNGQKKSEPFLIQGDRFKIAYDCTGDPSATYCGAFVYRVGSQIPQGVMNSGQPTKDETVIYTSMAGKGEYYIDANVLGSFTMTVYDFQ